ncbi:uncharacterized oxidoreductase YrbE-like isoform X2 [Mytilus edulis]|uniref:uncharacterized oxidoreductase YrbE-like isoform X2 n=1 Tax=Mytilus edulis TaxID=6550 RepID=UPI0039EEC9CC
MGINIVQRFFQHNNYGNVFISHLRKGAPCTTARYSTSGKENKRYNVGILGAGRIASSVHIKNILRNRKLVVKWIVDDSKDALANVQDEHLIFDVPFHPSKEVDNLLEDKSLDAVFVFTPTSTHADYICRSLNKGKNVLTEKPTGSTYDEIKLCYETAEKNNKILITGFQRRFDPLFQDIYAATRNGGIGDIQMIKLTNRDSPKPAYEFLLNTDSEGCNIVSDLAVHDIDMMVWMTNGELPESVYTIGHIHDPKLKSARQPDTAVVTLKFKNGIMCTIDLSRDAVYGYDIRLELFGSGGMASGESPRRSTSVTDAAHGALLRQLHHSFPQRFEGAFESLLTHFVDCMDGKTKPLITKEECLLVANISEKAVQSFVEGRAVQF